MPQLSDYTIDHTGVDWPDLLAFWAWLLPKELAVWITNRFGDLLLTFDDRQRRPVPLPPRRRVLAAARTGAAVELSVGWAKQGSDQ